MMKKIRINVDGIDDAIIKETALTYLGVIFIIMMGALFVWPRFADVNRIKGENAKVLARATSLENSLTALDKLDELVEIASQDQLFQALPINFAPGIVLDNLRSISRKTNITINDYSIVGGIYDSGFDASGSATQATGKQAAKKPTVAGLTSTEIKVRVAGTPLDLMEFIKALEESVPLLNVKDVQISEISKFMDEQLSDESLNMTLSLNSYYFPLQETFVADLETKPISTADLDTLKAIATYQKPVFQSTGVTGGNYVPGGNTNLFGE